MVAWNDTLARLRAEKAELKAREAEEQAARDQSDAEQADRQAEQERKEAERGSAAALQWVETADYESLCWVAEMSDDGDRRAMVRGKLARDLDEIFAIDLNENPLESDPALNAFFETIRDAVAEIDSED